MRGGIRKSRNGCVLHGALYTLGSLQGVVPIVHSTAGCVLQAYEAQKYGGPDDGLISGFEVPNTNVQERHVIFGGASRLREQIKNTLRVQNADLYVVLNSCESAMVGDDTDAMTKEVVEQGEPVINSILAGFHGDVHRGYDNAMENLFKKIPTVFSDRLQKSERNVNILGILPQQDIFYKGDLYEIKEILSLFGIRALTFFGEDGGLEELKEAAGAALTISFSAWGNKAAHYLKDEYGIPVVERAALPLGAEDTFSLMEEVAKYIPIDNSLLEEVKDKKIKKEQDLLSRIEKSLYELDVDRSIVIVADESTAVRLSAFIKRIFAVNVSSVIVTDFYASEDNKSEDAIRRLSGYADEILLSNDDKAIRDHIRSTGARIILGSSLERAVADEINAALLEISFPVADRLFLDKTYAGFRGAFTFIEDLVHTIRLFDRQEDERLKELQV